VLVGKESLSCDKCVLCIGVYVQGSLLWKWLRCLYLYSIKYVSGVAFIFMSWGYLLALWVASDSDDSARRRSFALQRSYFS